jgi:aminopeptidase N
MQPGGDQATRYAAIYNKGPYAFHMLRLTFGDEKFFKFLKDLAQELQKQEVVTLDIQHVAERSFGGVNPDGTPYNVDLGWFFDQWIRGVGMPEFSFNYTTRQAEDGSYVVQGNVKQRVVVGRDKTELPNTVFRGVASITVLGKDRKEYGPVRVVMNKAEEPFVFKVPVEPLEIVLNKNLDMLSHDVLVNRTW